jgi:LysM repeat protein
MKKILILLTAALTVSGMISCATTKPAVEEPKPVVPETVQEAFDYSQDNLIIDGSAKSYTVRRGDTLSSIAKRMWGQERGYYFPVIMLASRQSAAIDDPDVIEPGMQLTIPNLDVNLANDRARAAIKNYLKDVSGIYTRKFAESRDPKHDRTGRELAKLSDSL